MHRKAELPRVETTAWSETSAGLQHCCLDGWKGNGRTMLRINNCNCLWNKIRNCLRQILITTSGLWRNFDNCGRPGTSISFSSKFWKRDWNIPLTWSKPTCVDDIFVSFCQLTFNRLFSLSGYGSCDAIRANVLFINAARAKRHRLVWREGLLFYEQLLHLYFFVTSQSFRISQNPGCFKV